MNDRDARVTFRHAGGAAYTIASDVTAHFRSR